MNPQQDPSGNPYDFIMNPGQPQKAGPGKLLSVGGGNSFIVKLVMIIGGAIVLMIAVAILVNVLTGSKTNTTDLVTLAQTQTEIARVAGEGAAQGTTDATKNVAISTQLTISTQQAQLSKYLASVGKKVSPKDLGLKKNAQTDTQLTEAQANSTYDLVFGQVLTNQLNGYESMLKQYYATATSNTVKSLLATDYQQAQLLVEQIPSQPAAKS